MIFSKEEILIEFEEAADYTPRKTKALKVGDLLENARFQKQSTKRAKRKMLRLFKKERVILREPQRRITEKCLEPIQWEVLETRPCSCGGTWERRNVTPNRWCHPNGCKKGCKRQ